jgi:myo-inositol-1(or 4)-monophosphatase
MRLAVAMQATREAAEVLRKHFGRALEQRTKPDGTLVSTADEESEAIIRRIILGAFPTDAFVGEEGGKSGTGEYVWHVDPLDGTANFLLGMRTFAVSIGLEHRGEYVLGAVLNVFADELLTAEKGGGAFLNGERLKTASAPFETGLHVVDAHFKETRATKLAYLAELTKASSRIRMQGSNALQLAGVAKGLYVSSYSDTVHSWDIAAGTVLVREAGGACSTEGDVTLAASSPETLRQAIAIAGASSKNVSRFA